nr:MAG: hypothetical protein [Chemarfal virus 144]
MQPQASCTKNCNGCTQNPMHHNKTGNLNTAPPVSCASIMEKANRSVEEIYGFAGPPTPITCLGCGDLTPNAYYYLPTFLSLSLMDYCFRCAFQLPRQHSAPLDDPFVVDQQTGAILNQPLSRRTPTAPHPALSCHNPMTTESHQTETIPTPNPVSRPRPTLPHPQPHPTNPTEFSDSKASLPVQHHKPPEYLDSKVVPLSQCPNPMRHPFKTQANLYRSIKNSTYHRLPRLETQLIGTSKSFLARLRDPKTQWGSLCPISWLRSEVAYCPLTSTVIPHTYLRGFHHIMSDVASLRLTSRAAPKTLMAIINTMSSTISQFRHLHPRCWLPLSFISYLANWSTYDTEFHSCDAHSVTIVAVLCILTVSRLLRETLRNTCATSNCASSLPTEFLLTSAEIVTDIRIMADMMYGVANRYYTSKMSCATDIAEQVAFAIIGSKNAPVCNLTGTCLSIPCIASPPLTCSSSYCEAINESWLQLCTAFVMVQDSFVVAKSFTDGNLEE